MHPDAYKPGVMTYAYVKAPAESSAKFFAAEKGIRKDCIVKVAEIKRGELYMLHVVGHHSLIVDWFHEPGQAPYPMGSCLLYRSE